MKGLLIFSLSILIFITGLFLLLIKAESNTVVIKYDCRQLIAGWHPDFPANVIDKCRNREK
jgi:hypothetical protein